ncbi:MAG TPA: ABC transporter ATP-binding protein [Dialister sp.]|nr:ABC transporter ATP-binding protein [Dialister sp.]
MKPTLSVFLQTLRRNKFTSLLLLCSIVLSIGISILPPLVLQQVIDGLSATHVSRETWLLWALSYFAIVALSNLTEAGKETLITLFGQRTTHEIRSTLAAKLCRLPASYFVTHPNGQTTSLFVNDVDTIEDLFDSGIISMISDSFQIFSILFVVYLLSPGLFGLLLLALPLLFLLTRCFQKRMLSAQLAYRQALAAANGLIPETIRNCRAIRLFRGVPFMKRRYQQTMEDSFHAMDRSNFYDSIYSPIIITTSSLLIALMVSLSVAESTWQSLFGMTAGTVVALMAYVNRIFSPLESIGMEIEHIQSALAGMERISTFLEEKEIAIPVSTPSADTSSIVIDHITFGYEPSHPIFQDFSLTIPKGDMITLTGRTGIGKSTLFKLLCGLYIPQKGMISLFGQNPAAISEAERRPLFGIVEQSFRPVPGTIGDQISLQDPRISTAAIWDALHTVGLSALCESLPNQLDTPYTASLFSQGQKQLLSIARAIVMNPSLLLLDEITANLDAHTEKEVLTALRQASKHRTVISISHRLYQEQGGRRIAING